MGRARSCCWCWCAALILVGVILRQTIAGTESDGECRRQPTEKKAVAFFIFGDSIVDAGNNNYINTTTLDQANFWPYGLTFFNFPTGRFSDGRLIPDFIADYAKLPSLIPPYLQPGIDYHQYSLGVNFASAGAGALVETFRGAVINLTTQVSYYKKVEAELVEKIGNDEAQATVSTAVYLFSIGTNDYLSPFLTNSTALLDAFSHSQYVGMVLGNLTSVIHELYEKGGRNFGFLNLGPLGCFPAIRIIRPQGNGGCLEEASLLAELHNKALSKLLADLHRTLPGFRYSLFDFHTHLTRRMNHPSKYGFREGKAACCGTGKFRGVLSCGGKRPVKEFEQCHNQNDYVFWDSMHLSERAYRQLAHQLWTGGSNPSSSSSSSPSPSHNFKHLFHCL